MRLQEGFAPYRSQHEFRNWSEYHDYIRKFDIRSLKGEVVRSFEECEIANFLYLHGVAYEYEAPYEHDLATSESASTSPTSVFPSTASISNTSGSTPQGTRRLSSTGGNIGGTWSGSAVSIPSTALS